MATVQSKVAIKHLAHADLTCHIIEFSLAPMLLKCSVIVGLKCLGAENRLYQKS